MYSKDGIDYFVVDEHTHFWDGSPANQRADVDGGKKTPNPRLFAVPIGANREHDLEDVRQLSKRMRKELEKFFKQTAALESKEVEIVDWEGPKVAREVLDAAVARYRKTK